MWGWGAPALLLLLGLFSCYLGLQIVYCVLLLLPFLIYSRSRCRPVCLDPEGRAVLITGCDSGFGNLLAHRLQFMGFTVFATCLFPEGEGAQSLIKNSAPGKLKVVRLDVTSDKEVAEVKQYVQDNLPEKGLWGIVNNAGISMWGMSDWHSIDQYQKIVDINLLGNIRTTLAFAPLIRKSQGRMVFLSSISAYISFRNGIYSMTKAGVERFCDSLRLEMRMFGVSVCIIEPGNYAQATNIQPLHSGEDIWNSLPAEAQETYSKESVMDLTDFVNKELSKGSSKGHEVVDAIVDALTSAKPKPRYLVANLKEKILVYFCSCFPTSFVDAVYSLATRKKMSRNI
ncbi:retinol dehydrogenase 7-like [Ascaphus truei]|uniref:retinol dehydrogenase 7-like n=1 Tax=Ascaphus truei TaxID=8439 RepID=UPI003F597E4F